MDQNAKPVISIDVASITEAVVGAVRSAMLRGGSNPCPPHPHGGDIVFRVSFYVGGEASTVASTQGKITGGSS
jgi:hypothetical protein